MDGATLTVTLDETADLQEQVRTLKLGDGKHIVATFNGVEVEARIENGKVVEYIANDHAARQQPAAHSNS
jgi:hypothetical protein